MRITIVYNPKSGRGKAGRLASGMGGALRERGHAVTSLDMLADPGRIEESMGESDRLVVVGGDGTVHHLLPVLAERRTPVYHCGTGTANLIGRGLGMSARPAAVVRDLEREHPPMMLDMPLCNGHPFLIMVSIGIDASVIHRFEESRRLGGYRSYVLPVIREVLRPRPARFSVRRGDEDAVAGPTTGILVIANMPGYGGGLNPCPGARCDDGMVDTVAIPSTTSVGAGLKYAALRLRLTIPSMRRMKTASCEVMAEDREALVQIDGEKAVRVPGLAGGRLGIGDRLRISMDGRQICMHSRAD